MSDLGHGVVRALRPVGATNDFQNTAHYGAIYGGSYGGAAAANGAARAVSAFPVNDDLRRRVSDEELELLILLADGLPVEAIARRLALSDRTVRRRSRAMCDRLGARAPIQVVAWAARQGLI